jgi:hypothetical protein
LRLIEAFSSFLVYFFAFLSAHGTVFCSASSTACRFFGFTSAPGTGIGASSTAGSMGTGQVDTASADETGDAETGEQFFEIFVFHSTSQSG